MNGEMWIAGPYKAYAALAAKGNSMFTTMGPEMAKLALDGLTMRSIMRGDMYGGKEIEQVVTKIGEETASPDLFEIPAGFKEIPAPAVKIGGGVPGR